MESSEAKMDNQDVKPTVQDGDKKSGDVKSASGIASKFAESALLDMVFVMDATGSMGSYIRTAQQTIRDVVQEIVATEKADVRFGLVSYRDHPPQDSTYVTNVFPFTPSVRNMREHLDTLSASGGGDGPEAVVDGLQAALKLDWRENSTKVCILIADAPPHGLDVSGDGFPNGCPCGLDPMAVCRNMAEAGITLYCIGCEPSVTQYKPFFSAIATITGGQYCPLGNAAALSSAVVCGVREEICLERVMGEAREHIAASKDMSEKEQCEYLQSHLKAEGYRTKQTWSGSTKLAAATPAEVVMSKAATLDDVRKTFTPTSSASAAPRASYSGGSMRAKSMAMKKTAPGGGGGGILSSVMGWMGLGSGSTAEGAAPHGDLSGDDHDVLSACDAVPSAAAMPAPDMGGSYSVMEDAVSMEQCARMVSKTRARKS